MGGRRAVPARLPGGVRAVTLWAIAYTLHDSGRPRKAPYIFNDTVAHTRRAAWETWSKGWTAEQVAEMKAKYGAKAIKVRVEVVP